jgi:hypothetical protein
MRSALFALAIVAASEAFAPVSVGSAPQVRNAPLAAPVRRRAVPGHQTPREAVPLLPWPDPYACMKWQCKRERGGTKMASMDID